MSSDRRSVEGELPDGIADRQQGYTHNPNPPDEVAANRARFEEKQREIQADHNRIHEALDEVDFGEQYRKSMNDPRHQAFIPDQIAHQQVDPAHERGGQEHDTTNADPELIANMEYPRKMPGPGGLRDLKHRESEE